MRSDRRGEMGFMEAMVAFMAVTVVLTGYLGAMAGMAAVPMDPTDSIDPDEFTGSIADGVFEPSYLDYMGTFLDATSCSGMAVAVRIPGGFCEEQGPTIIGEMDGHRFSRVFVSTVSDDQGRTVPAVFEVTVCA